MNLSDYQTSFTPLWIYFGLVFISLVFIVKKKLYIFDHEQLLKQTPFQIAILAPFFSFLYFGFLSWKGHTPQFDSEGMGVFLDISKLPLLILSLTLPLGALAANIHRTFQTKKQIELVEAKNLSDMYYAHNKSYVESFSKVNANRPIRTSKNKKLDDYLKNINELSVFIAKPNSLYQEFYPLSSPELGPQYEPSRKSLIKIKIILDKILDATSAIDSETISKKKITGITRKDEEFSKIVRSSLTLCKYLGLDDYITYYRFYDAETEDINTQLKIASVELVIYFHKLYLILSEVLNIIGITKKTHPELINKCNKLRSCSLHITKLI